MGRPEGFSDCHPVQVTIDPIAEQMAVPWRFRPLTHGLRGQPAVAQAASLTAGRPCSASSSSSGCTPIWLANVVEVRGRDRRFARSRVVSAFTSSGPAFAACPFARVVVVAGAPQHERCPHGPSSSMTPKPRWCSGRYSARHWLAASVAAGSAQQ